MDTSALEGIGLSPTEIKVFISILELGESKAGSIIRKSGLQSSSMYNSLGILIKKGLVSYINKSQVKFYKAADPETILDYIDLKKTEYLKLLPELKAKQNKTNKEGVEFFKSYKGIRTLLLIMLKDSKKGDIYRTFAISEPELYGLASEKVFGSIKSILKERKVIPKGIFHESTRKNPDKYSIMEKRYVDFSMPPNTIIINGKVAIITWASEPSGILINSKDIYESYAGFFDEIWKIGKK